MADWNKARLIRSIRQLYVRGEPLNLTAVKRRHPDLVERVYAVRPYWGWKQALADAGIDYATIPVELEDQCTCLICGGTGAILTAHLKGIHQMTPEEYREQFPGAEVVSETVRAAKMKARVRLPHWEPLWSWEYALDRTWMLYSKGWPINCVDIQGRERALFQYVWHRGRQWDEVLEALGLKPDEIRKQAVGVHLNSTDVVRGLKARLRTGRGLADSVVCREDLRLYNAARRAFGSYNEALRAAEIDPARVQLRRPNITAEDIAKLRREMKHVASLHGHARAAAASALKKQYKNLVFNRLGNWSRACRRFGIKPEGLAVSPYASKTQVIEGLRRWALVPGGSGQRIYREDCPLYKSACRRFGSWPAAKRAAGVTIGPSRQT